jgi:hypothetical protein
VPYCWEFMKLCLVKKTPGLRCGQSDTAYIASTSNCWFIELLFI